MSTIHDFRAASGHKRRPGDLADLDPDDPPASPRGPGLFQLARVDGENVVANIRRLFLPTIPLWAFLTWDAFACWRTGGDGRPALGPLLGCVVTTAPFPSSAAPDREPVLTGWVSGAAWATFVAAHDLGGAS
jgi:hypothetical protein